MLFRGLLATVLCLPHLAHADEGTSTLPLWQQFLPVSVSLGGGAWIPSWGTFDRFADAYAEVEGANLQAPIDDFETAFVPRLGIKIGRSNGISGTFYGSFASSKTQARFGSDERREFEVTTRSFGMDLKFNLKGVNAAMPGIELITGFFTGSAKLTSGYRYNADTLSYGLDKVLNGQFRIAPFTGVFGIGLTKMLGPRMALFAQLNYLWTFTTGNAPNQGARLGVADNANAGNNGYAPIYNNVEPTRFIGTTADELYDPETYSVGNSRNIVDRDLGGLQIFAGIEVKVSPW